MLSIGDFRTDLRDALVAHLARFGYAISTTSDPDDVLVTYLNVARRRVEPRARKVCRSRVLNSRALNPERAAVLAAIEGAATSGGDLNAFLHTALKKDPEFNDALLNDWGMHHFHLGSTAANSATGLTVRSCDLLFAIVRESEMYFLDVRNHGSFADDELAAIAHEEWPHLLPAILGLHPGDQVSASTRHVARKNGLQTLLTMTDGTMYGPPGGGYATSGLSIAVRVDADRIWKFLDALHEDILASAHLPQSGMSQDAPILLRLEPVFEGFLVARWMLRDASGTPVEIRYVPSAAGVEPDLLGGL